MKHLTFFTTFFLINFVFGQQLSPTTFNLNPGGYVSDVVYFEPSDSYIIVGEFNSINGVPRSNIAFLNSSLTQLQSYNPILGSDGYFQTITVYQNRIFVGGDFTSLNPNYSMVSGSLGSESCIFEMQYTNDLEFVNRNWNIESNYAPYAPSGVNDLEVYGDTLVIAGSFYTTALPIAYNLAAFDLSSNQIDPNFASATQGSPEQVFDIEKLGQHIYCSGNQTVNGNEFCRINLSGQVDNSFNPPTISANAPSPYQYYCSIHGDENKILAAVRHNAGLKFGYYNTSGTVSTSPSLPIVSGEISDLNIYKTQIIRSQSAHGSIYAYNYINGQLSNNWNKSVNSGAFNVLDHPKRDLNIARNHLFISSSNLQNIQGQNVSGLGIICMEPWYMTNFTEFEDLVCPGQTIQFKIDSVKYASGYRWSYSGSGAEIGGIDISQGVDLIGADKNQVMISFVAGFSPGNLTVRAFSECGALTKDSSSIFIDQLPLPSYTALNDTQFTCTVDSIILSGLPNPGYTSTGWYDFQSSYHSGLDILTTIPGEYIFEITDPQNCKNFDTIQIAIDTIQPNHQVSHTYFELNCIDSIITLHASSSTPNTISYWKIDGAIHPDSIQVLGPGTFTSITENLFNGCKDSIYTLVDQNYTPPDFFISGYANLNTNTPLDTLNCLDTFLVLEAITIDTNHISFWIDSSFTNLGQSLNINTPGAYLLYAKNINSGCSGVKQISIIADTSAPNLLTQDDLALSCSLDSVRLISSTYGFTYEIYWEDSFNQILADSSNIGSPGDYYLHITDTMNGCKDSLLINVSFDPIIQFAIDSFLVCKSTNHEIWPNPIYDESLNYSWNTGSTDSSIIVNIESNENYFLEVYNSDSTCFGMTELDVHINPKPEIEIVSLISCTNAEIGSIEGFVLTGYPPFEFSLDTMQWQNNFEFDSIPVGFYTLFIEDSLECIHQYENELNSSSSQPEVNFLVATSNQILDSIFIDLLASPIPDSTFWDFDNNSIILYDDPLKPVIQYTDTGQYTIELQAYFNDCIISKSKLIVVQELDTNQANLNNQNGIESLTIYPNPTSNNITVDLSFYKKQNCRVLLTDLLGIELYTSDFNEVLQIVENINLESLNLSTGTYLIYVVGEFDKRVVQINFSR